MLSEWRYIDTKQGKVLFFLFIFLPASSNFRYKILFYYDYYYYFIIFFPSITTILLTSCQFIY